MWAERSSGTRRGASPSAVSARSTTISALRPAERSVAMALPKYGPEILCQSTGIGSMCRERNASRRSTAATGRHHATRNTGRMNRGTWLCTGEQVSWNTAAFVGSAKLARAAYAWCTSPESTHTDAVSVFAMRRISRVSRSDEARNDGQCSRSAPCRSFSASRPRRPGRRQATSFMDWRWLIACGISHGSEEPISRWSKSPVAFSSIHSNSPSPTIERAPPDRIRPDRVSITSSRTLPKSRR
jgi:hypothetical protein